MSLARVFATRGPGHVARLIQLFAAQFAQGL